MGPTRKLSTIARHVFGKCLDSSWLSGLIAEVIIEVKSDPNSPLNVRAKQQIREALAGCSEAEFDSFIAHAAAKAHGNMQVHIRKEQEGAGNPFADPFKLLELLRFLPKMGGTSSSRTGSRVLSETMEMNSSSPHSNH